MRLALLCFALSACAMQPEARVNRAEATSVTVNPVHYFEIPVSDLDRAIGFYSMVFGYRLERTVVDGHEMALFPGADGGSGASGALAQGDVYVPSVNGAIIYFSVDDIDPVLLRATSLGAEILYPKKSIGAQGFVAEIRDSEGNRIALHARAD
jgi:predicted enzyme related to lactoylglutathione lyase